MLRLILPILFPSWRFFNSIGPSPRIMLRFNEDPWQEYRPKPAQLGLRQRLIALFYNPIGNKTLFVHSCAVRLFDGSDPSAVENIFLALAQAITQHQLQPPDAKATLTWRVEQLDWQGTHSQDPGKIVASVIYTSESRAVAALELLWRADSKLCR